MVSSGHPASAKLLGDIVVDLKMLPFAYQENDFRKLAEEMEREHTMKLQYYEYLLMDKIELLQAIEEHKKELAFLMEEKQLFIEYLENAKNLSQKMSYKTYIRTKKLQNAQNYVATSAVAVVNPQTGSIKKFY